MTYKKKLIEVAIPLDGINKAAVRELQNPFLSGHPKGLKWWARLPLAVCRAVIWATYVDDPSSNPDLYPTAEIQEEERQRLFAQIEALANWESTADEALLQAARDRVISDADGSLPPVIDPFSGGASIPLEAQRLGLDTFASDLNPVAVLIGKSLVEAPAACSRMSPVHPGAAEGTMLKFWDGAEGLADDLRHYGKWVEEQARTRVGHLYPEVALREPGRALAISPTGWLWARTAKCPNPACLATIPLMKSFQLSRRKGKETALDPIAESDGSVRFVVRQGSGGAGTMTRSGASCPSCGTGVNFAYLRAEGKEGRLGAQMVAIIAQPERGRRIFVEPSARDISAADVSETSEGPHTSLPDRALGFRVQAYGMTGHRSLFTHRQLLALSTLVELVGDARDRARADAVRAGLSDDAASLWSGGDGATAYSDAVALLLGQALARTVMFHNTLCKWNITNENIKDPFGLQTLSMVWDFVEANPVVGRLGYSAHADLVAGIVEKLPASRTGHQVVSQLDASAAMPSSNGVVITDPPYYDNVGYSDLADFFYVWLRLAIPDFDPQLFSTLKSPKKQELVADGSRHDGDSRAAKESFRKGLQSAFTEMLDVQDERYPLSVFYAFKQAEEDDANGGVVSTGWEAMLDALLKSGFMIVRTWPLQTVRPARTRGLQSNALSSSVLLVCRKRAVDAPLATRSEFVARLRKDLPVALHGLQQLNTRPVDLAQAAIGPGMSVFSEYSRVVEADGSPMSIRSALAIINEQLREALSKEETEFDPSTRWAVTWYEQYGMEPGPYGQAETLSKAKNTAVEAVITAGIASSSDGQVRLVRGNELADGWEPGSKGRVAVWQLTQHLISALGDSEAAAAALLREAGGGLGERARQLAYLLHQIADRRGWTEEAGAFNSLVQAWPDVSRLARSEAPVQQKLGE